jgi:flagellar hook-associated protein 2
MSTSSTGLVSSNGTELIAGASYTDGNGINVSQTVSAILEADRAPETAWQNDQTTITNQETALTNLQTEISTLQTSFQNLSDYSGVFSSLTATSSDTSEVSATAGTAATSGSHTIVVTSLASTGESYSNDVSSGSITAGALVFTLGSGSQQTINIPADSTTDGTTSTTTTLSNAATYINQQNLGVTATVITDSNGSRLALTSTASGAAASVAVQSAPDGLSFTDIAGTDAALTVDGVPIDSSTNQITTAIPGLTLNLTGTTSASGVTVQVAPSTDQITTAVNSFITAYNAAVTDLNGQFQYNAGVAAGSSSSSSTSTSGVLESDASARLIQEQLLSSVSVAGSDSSSSNISTLAQLGITMNDDGTLTLNSSTLASALQSNYGSVQSFFQSTSSSSFAGNFSDLMTSMTDPTNSAIVLDLSGLKSNYTNDQTNINNLETTLANLKTSLTNQYSALNTTLQMYPTTLIEVETELGFRSTTNNSNS